MFDLSLLIYASFFFLLCTACSPSNLSHSFENTKVWCRWIGLPEDKKFDTDCRNFPIKLYIRWRAVKRNSCLKHLISYYLEREVLSEAITLNRLKSVTQHIHQQHIMDIIAMNNWNLTLQSGYFQRNVQIPYWTGFCFIFSALDCCSQNVPGTWKSWLHKNSSLNI